MLETECVNYSESEKPWEVAKGRAVAEEREGKEGVREEGGWAGGGGKQIPGRPGHQVPWNWNHRCCEPWFKCWGPRKDSEDCYPMSHLSSPMFVIFTSCKCTRFSW